MKELEALEQHFYNINNTCLSQKQIEIVKRREKLLKEIIKRSERDQELNECKTFRACRNELQSALNYFSIHQLDSDLKLFKKLGIINKNTGIFKSPEKNIGNSLYIQLRLDPEIKRHLSQKQKTELFLKDTYISNFVKRREEVLT